MAPILSKSVLQRKRSTMAKDSRVLGCADGVSCWEPLGVSRSPDVELGGRQGPLNRVTFAVNFKFCHKGQVGSLWRSSQWERK